MFGFQTKVILLKTDLWERNKYLVDHHHQFKKMLKTCATPRKFPSSPMPKQCMYIEVAEPTKTCLSERCTVFV